VIAMHEDAMQALPVEYLDAYRAVNRLAARVLSRGAGCDERLAGISSRSATKSHLTEVGA
jgi:hypothetical protein